MKLRSPAAARNVEPIGDVLAEWLPSSGLVLEVASGSGEHALAFARRFPHLTWQPSDPDAAALASVETWRAEEGPRNLLPPVRLDVAEREWPVAVADAVLSINMVHISPWEASLGLLDGAARLLAAGGPLILYGPWIVDGEPTAPSNLLFDADLKRRNASWGLRRVAAFAEEAAKRGLALDAERAMPANNRMLLFRSAAA
jgi:SAM-dependent methyltransferase